MKGFTLAELLVYLGLTALIGSLLAGVLIVNLRIQSRETGTVELNNQLNFVNQTIQRMIKESSLIEMEAGKTLPYLRLWRLNTGDNPTLIVLNGTQIDVKEGSAATTTLTAPNVSIESLAFTKYINYPGHDTVQYSITMSYAPPGQPSVSKTIRSAVGRVSAATFDGNLAPGSHATYNIGSAGVRWNNIFGQTIQLGGGSTSSPAYSFTSDSDSGITSGGADNMISFITGGSARVILDKSGNVGIATTSPWGLLSVNPSGITGPAFAIGSSTKTDFVVTNGGNVGIGTTNPDSVLHVAKTNTNADTMVHFQNTGSGTATISLKLGEGTPESQYLVLANLGVDNSSRLYAIGPGTSGVLAFHTGLTSYTAGSTAGERMRIDAAGNVGIGITNPGTGTLLTAGGPFLHVSGSGGGVLILERTAPAAVRWDIGPNTEGKLFIAEGAATEGIVITPAGNVGIGTTNPGGGIGSHILSLSNTPTAPTPVTGVSHLYTSGGEGYWMDGAGNVTLQTPHDKETGEWIFYSKNIKTGKVLRVDMEKLVKFIDEKFGTDFVKELTIEEIEK